MTPEEKKAEKLKKKLDRKEGRRVKSLCPMNYVSPYIMVDRTDATNYIADRFDIGPAEDYIFKKREEGLAGFGMMHVILASFIRMYATHPEMNRFLRGQKIYARNCIECMLTIKLEMKVNAPETVLKIIFPPDSTAEDVYRIMQSEIEKARSADSSFDDTARFLNYVPGLVLKWAMWNLKLLDYFGLLPRKLTKLSPFHGSFAITSMGSLGIPPIYHHLYNFGNIPIFLAFGKKYKENLIADDGSVEQHRYVDFRVTCDERVADGHAYASALKELSQIVKRPEQLDAKPEKVLEDIP